VTVKGRIDRYVLAVSRDTGTLEYASSVNVRVGREDMPMASTTVALTGDNQFFASGAMQ
jgi:hypothetical protein